MVEYHSDNLSIEYPVIENNLNYSLSYLSFRRDTYNFSAAAESLIIVKFLNLTVMKKLLIIAIIFTIFDIKAQKISLGEYDNKKVENVAETIVVDTAKWEIIYAHVSKDKILDKEKADFEMLAIGNNYMWYGGYGNFQMDSIYISDPNRIKSMTVKEYRALRSYYKPISSEMLRDNKNSIIHHFDKIFINNYKYEESLPEFDWNLEPETMEVMGHTCYKATTSWRGRDWTAWYCDIPMSAGPWKFNGLPGLILRLEDSDGNHLFDAIETKNITSPIGYKKRLRTKISREKFNEGLKDYKENAGKYFSNSGLINMSSEETENLKKKRSFFVPIELE